MSLASRPCGPRRAMASRAQRSVNSVDTSPIDPFHGTDDEVFTCDVPAKEWPSWTDDVVFTTQAAVGEEAGHGA